MQILLTIILMCILTGAEVDLYVPSFPELQEQFGLTPFMVEMTLSINLAAHCLTSLVAGTLGDRYGRKPVLLAGLGIFIVGSLFCFFAESYWHLLMGRAFQGIGISAPAVLSYILISDLYPENAQQRLMGLISGVVTLAMALAPIVGSGVAQHFHWRGNFFALLLLGIICFFLTAVYLPKGQSDPSVHLSLKGYGVVFKSPQVLAHISTLTFLALGFWTFVSISPILYMEGMGVPLSTFGYYQGSACAVYALGSFMSGSLIRQFGSEKMMRFSYGALALFVLTTLLLLISGMLNPLWITASMCLMAIGVLFPMIVLYPRCLMILPEAKGRISALLTSVRLISTAFLIQIVSYYYAKNYTSLSIGLLFSMVGIFFSILWVNSYARRTKVS